MKITIGEIAKLAGVSKTTVSRVINNKPDVDPVTREKIHNLVSDYGFQPNAFAKAISLQKSDSIGLLIPHKAEYVFSNQFYTEVMRGVSTEVDEQGYYLLICYAHEVNYLDIYRQKRVDGFILLSPGSYHKDIINALNNEEVPFVSTAKISEEGNLTYVDVDNYYGATLAVEHLISLGHRKIGFIGKPTLTSSLDRLKGYQDVLTKYGIAHQEEYTLITNTSSVDSGHDYLLKMLSCNEPPTAVFLANDVMAIGAIQAVQEYGLRVPDDISIVGFDDIPLAKYANPSLTTVRQPSFEKGRCAARLLISMLENEEFPECLNLEVELMVRNSTAVVKK